MKIAFTTFACPNWSLRQVLKAATKHQYHGVELRLDAGHGHGVEAWTSAAERKIFKEHLGKTDVKIACLASSLQFIVEGIVDHALERIKLAADVDAPALRVFCGPLPEGTQHFEEVAPRVTRQLREAAEAADVMGVQLWVETHDSLSRGADMANLVRMVDRANVGVCYNNLHPIRRGEALESTMAHLAGMIRHVHLHDGLNRPDKVIITPMGIGDMPIDEVILALRNLGYTGYLCGEWFHKQYGDRPDDALELYSHEVRNLTLRHHVALGLL